MLVRRQRDLPEGDRPPGRGARRCPASCCWWRPTRPTWRRSRCAASRTSRPTSSTPRGSWPSCAASPYEELERDRRAQRRARSSAGERERRGQASLRRLREFGVRPNRELGQNFLIDDNILRRDRRARPSSTQATSCSRWAAASACCREYLAPRVAHLHVVEMDRVARAAARGRARPVRERDAAPGRRRGAGLRASSTRRPRKVVANLPYGVAATVLLKSVAELPGGGRCGWRWCSARWPSGWPPRRASKTYGATSVLAQLAVRGARRCARCRARCSIPSRTWTRRCVVLRRRAPAPPAESSRSCTPASRTGARRWPGSLALDAGRARGHPRRDPRRARGARPPADARAERLPPEDWPRLADAIGRERLADLRPR